MSYVLGHVNWVRRALVQARKARRMPLEISDLLTDAVYLAKLDEEPLRSTFSQQVAINHRLRTDRVRRDARLRALAIGPAAPMRRERPYQRMGRAAALRHARRERHDHDVAAENLAETRKVSAQPKPDTAGLYPADWQPPVIAREALVLSHKSGKPVTIHGPKGERCECEACFGGRKLRAWLDNDEGQQERDPETGKLLRPDAAPDFAETAQAMSAHDRCRARVCFPDVIDTAAIGLLSVTVNGMPGRTIDWLDAGRIREDGEVKTRWVGKIAFPGPFEAQAQKQWDWTQYVAHRCTQVAVHEGIETERGYRAHPLWQASEERLDREYAGIRRVDVFAPLDPADDQLDEDGRVPAGWYPDNALIDDEGRVVLGLSAYEYFRRQVEARKGQYDPIGRYWNGLAVGTYMPRGLWQAFYEKHVVEQRTQREYRKVIVLLRNLGLDPKNPAVGARVRELGIVPSIKQLYRLHRERGVALPF